LSANIAKLITMLKSALKYLTILTILLVPILSNAQIANIEKFRLDKDTSNLWLGNTGFSLSSKKQKNVVNEYSAYLNLVYLSKRHSYMTLNYTDLQQLDKYSFISEGYTHWRINFFRRNRLSYEPFVQFQYDKGRGLLKRNLYGYCFRLNLLKYNKNNDRFDLGVSTGAMYEEEEWSGKVVHYETNGDTSRTQTHFIKSTSNLFARASLHEKITLFASVYYQARFEKFNYPRVVSDLQLVFKVTKVLSLNSGFGATYDSYPVVSGNIFTYKLSGGFLFKLN
jgi:hypothetical protein